MEQFEAIERRAAIDGLSFGEAMRMSAGAGIAEEGRPGRTMSAGARRWPARGFSETVAALRSPDGRLCTDHEAFEWLRGGPVALPWAMVARTSSVTLRDQQCLLGSA